MLMSKPVHRVWHLRSLAALLWATALLAACAAPAARTATTGPLGGTVVIRTSGSGSALPLVTVLADAFAASHEGVSFEFRGGTNSGGAISGVVAGTLDLAVVNRVPSDEEMAAPLAYHSFARDAVVFAVRLPNDLKDMSAAQLQSVYGGATTEWQELGILSGPIIVLDRDESESMRKLVLLEIMGDKAVEARSVVLASSGEMTDALSSTPGALGYTSLALLRVLRPENVATLAFDGVVAGADTVASGTYPWSMTFGLAHRDDARASVKEFVAWVQSAAGQRMIESFDALPLAE